MKKGIKWLCVLLVSLALTMPSSEAWAKKKTIRKAPAKHRVVKRKVVKRRARPAKVQKAADPVAVYEDEPVREFPGNDGSPLWDFWKNTFEAREKLDRGDAKGALALLKDLGPPPADIINKGQSFYRRLYRQALQTGLEAARQQGESANDWRRKLWAYYPERNYERPETIEAGDKIVRLHLMSQKALFDEAAEMISLADIEETDASRDDKCRAYFELGWARQKSGAREDAPTAYARVAESDCEGKLVSRALYWKGSVESDLKRYDAAADTLKKLAKHSDENRYADDAYYRLSKVYRAQNDDEAAARAIADLIKLPEGDMKEKYLWDEAFAAFENRDYDSAVENLDRIIATRSIGTEAQPQALYWKGRIAEIRSKKKLGGGSSGIYHQVLKNYPFSFYALLAEARLGDSAPIPAVTKSKPASPSNKEFAGALGVVDELNKRKESDAARDVLDYLTYIDRAAAEEKPEAIADRWGASGDYNRALELAAGSMDKSLFDINLAKESPLTRSLYPLAYEKIVKEEASGNRLPMPLILGIMREESLFQRTVRSHAGAIGLMQLMPATARMKAKGLGMAFSLGDLHDPEVNIKLGSSFLRDLMNRFGEQTPLAVMGYNAGPGNVNKWLGSQGSMPLDEFIENIPFSETRGYVKRVLRSAHIYNHLLGQSKRPLLVPSMEPPRS